MDTVFAAIAEPNRLRMIELLRDGPSSVTAIVEQLQLKQPLVSKHLRTLTQAGIVCVRPQAQKRIYELNEAKFKEIDMWLDSFAQTWAQRLDNLDSLLQTVKDKHER
jgi:DNA-binding transcriptional ArsR family regulator